MNKNRIIFHIDVNNAFLSWSAIKLLEEGYKTDIRTIPAVIGGDESKRHGIVLAKSPIAKNYGIKTAETLYSARSKCPGLKIFSADYEYYKIKSNQLFAYLSQFTPDMEVFSIDECFLDLTNTRYLYKDLVSLAYKMKDDIYKLYGFTVNIGIGNNKLCAKMASDFEKPDKVHTLYKDEIKSKMWELDVEELFMVGKQTSKKLRELNINTIGELANSDLSFLKKHFKNYAVTLWEYANGKDESRVVSSSDINKCISTSETFEIDVDDIERLKKTLLIQTQKISKTLREQNMYANTVGIIIKTFDFKKYSRQIHLDSSTNSTKDIYNSVLQLFDTFWDGTKIRNIGVRISNFTNICSKQISLFEEEKPVDMIDRVLDEINDKYGNSSITFAGVIKENKNDKWSDVNE
ncbi:MAG: DNA polymerase IV [Bacilli bacterium]